MSFDKKIKLDFYPLHDCSLTQQLKLQGYIPKDKEAEHKLKVQEDLCASLYLLKSFDYIDQTELQRIASKMYLDIVTNLIIKVSNTTVNNEPDISKDC